MSKNSRKTKKTNRKKLPAGSKTIRITDGKLTSKEVEECGRMTKRYQTQDEGFAQDLLSLVHTSGHGLFNLSKVRSVARAASGITNRFSALCGTGYETLKKRHKILKDISRLPAFKEICKTAKPVEACDKFMAILRELYAEVAESKCASCPHQSKCARASGLGSVLSKLPPAYLKKCGCSSDNALDKMHLVVGVLKALSNAEMAAFLSGAQNNDPSAKKLLAIMDGSGGGYSTGNGKDFDGTFTGTNLVDKIKEFIKRLESSNLVINELARKFRVALQGGSKEKMEHSLLPDKSREVTVMESVRQIPKALPRELADDDLLDAKIATKSLMIYEDQKPKAQKQVLYILLDSSLSMNEPIAPNVYSLLKKAHLASALTLSMLSKMKEDGSLAFFRFFASRPDRLQVARKGEDYVHVCRQIGLGDYNGGGTSIPDAIECAVKDIRAEKSPDIKKAEILLVTDGESNFSSEDWDKWIKDSAYPIKLHVLDIGTTSVRSPYYNIDEMKESADSYYEVDPNSLDLDEIVRTSVSES